MRLGLLAAFGLALSGCHAVEVRPGVCTPSNEILRDELLGNWTFDVSAATVPIAITRAPLSSQYHLQQTVPPANDDLPGGLNINFDFKLCQLRPREVTCEPKGGPCHVTPEFVFAELIPELADPAVHVVALRLVELKTAGIAWMFERVDPNRADLSGLSFTQEPPSGGVPGSFLIDTTGAPLVQFLLDAPYASAGLLR